MGFVQPHLVLSADWERRGCNDQQHTWQLVALRDTTWHRVSVWLADGLITKSEFDMSVNPYVHLSDLRLTAQGGHMIPIEQPELIVQATVRLIDRGR